MEKEKYRTNRKRSMRTEMEKKRGSNTRGQTEAKRRKERGKDL